MRKAWFLALAGAMAMLTPPAGAETNTLRMSKQFGLPYLPMILLEDQKLIEKHAKAADLGDITVTWTTLAGPAAQLDAILAGQLDFIGPGVPTLATAWDKTVGTPQEMRALTAMQSMPYVLVTRNPNEETIADFTDADKIALPAVKLTGHALALEMAAAKLWGDDKYDKLDPITITRAHPDAAAALLSGSPRSTAISRTRLLLHRVGKAGHSSGAEVLRRGRRQAHQWRAARDQEVLRGKSETVRGDPGGVRRGERLHQGQPEEVRGSLSRTHRRKDIARRTGEDGLRSGRDYTTTPVNVMTFVDFMHKVGRIKKKPGSWKDMFFPTAHGINGS